MLQGISQTIPATYTSEAPGDITGAVNKQPASADGNSILATAIAVSVTAQKPTASPCDAFGNDTGSP